MFATALLLQEDRLTIGEIVGNIPHDGPAFLVYALVAAFVFLIWYGNRKSGENAPRQRTGDIPPAGQSQSGVAQGNRPQTRPAQGAQRGSQRRTGR